MNFNNLEGSSERKLDRHEIMAKLSRYCKEKSNPIVFKDFGLDDESELIENNKIKDEVLKGLGEDQKDSIEFSLEILKSFLQKPIFTDDFDLDHYKRREWEPEYIEKGELSPEAREYYYSNRLGTNRGWGGVIKEIEALEETIINENIKDRLEDLKNNIPHDFFDKKYEVVKGVKIETYHILLKDEKVEVVKKLSKVVEEMILLLTEKEN